MNIFSRKMLLFFLTFAQNIDCRYTLQPPRRGGTNEYAQFMFWSKNKKNRYTTAYLSFIYMKWGLMGYILHAHIFLVCSHFHHSRQQIHSSEITEYGNTNEICLDHVH